MDDLDQSELIIDNGGDDAPVSNDNAQGDNQPTPELEGQLIDNDEAASDEKPEAPSPEAPEEVGEGAGDNADAGGEADVPEPDTPRPAADKPPAPEPVADPGTEFTPKNDYAFDIELADGSKVRITKPEDIEQLPTNADFGTPANLMKAQAKLNAMTSGIEQERRDYEATKEKFDAQEKQAAETEQRVNTMVAEMNYLESKGALPKVADEHLNADWSDPKVQQQPGVKERLDLLNYRAAENQTREKLGLSPMSLLEAATQMRLEGQQAKAAEVKDKQAQVRKAKGAMVGGSGASVPSSIPDDLIIGEGGNVRDLNPAY